jgi:hypothetical protein
MPLSFPCCRIGTVVGQGHALPSGSCAGCRKQWTNTMACGVRERHFLSAGHGPAPPRLSDVGMPACPTIKTYPLPRLLAVSLPTIRSRAICGSNDCYDGEGLGGWICIDARRNS